MSSHVARIEVTVVMDDGESHTLVTDRPGPQGSNPRFIRQQIDAGMGVLVQRLRFVADMYGNQIIREEVKA